MLCPNTRIQPHMMTTTGVCKSDVRIHSSKVFCMVFEMRIRSTKLQELIAFLHIDDSL